MENWLIIASCFFIDPSTWSQLHTTRYFPTLTIHTSSHFDQIRQFVGWVLILSKLLNLVYRDAKWCWCIWHSKNNIKPQAATNNNCHYQLICRFNFYSIKCQEKSEKCSSQSSKVKSLSFFFCSTSSPKTNRVFICKQKQQIFTSKSLELANVWEFCWKTKLTILQQIYYQNTFDGNSFSFDGLLIT